MAETDRLIDVRLDEAGLAAPTPEVEQERKVAANQAWFEYMPCNLSDAEGVPGVTQHAADFAPTEVVDTPYSDADVDADNMVTEANNLAAIDSMTIYRSFRYGQHVELVVTETEPGFKGDTSSNTTKPAMLETGLQVNVPLFVNAGDKLKIDTRTGAYVERVKG